MFVVIEILATKLLPWEAEKLLIPRYNIPFFVFELEKNV